VSIRTSVGGQAHGGTGSIPHGIEIAHAHSTQTVFYAMAAVLAATFLLTIRFYPRRPRLAEEPTQARAYALAEEAEG